MTGEEATTFICEGCKNAQWDQESYYTPAYVDDCACGNGVLDEDGEPIKECDDFEPCNRMTRDEAIELLDNLTGMVEDNQNSDYDTALKMAIKALEQEPCEDAVSRTKAMEICKSRGHDNSAHYISELPPVTPKRKHGEWERETFDLGENLPVRVAYQCSECGNYFDSEFNFCPHCGSNMKGGEE